MDINYSYKRNSEESRNDFYKYISQNIYIAIFRPMCNITYIYIYISVVQLPTSTLDTYRRQNEEDKEEEEEEEVKKHKQQI